MDESKKQKYADDICSGVIPKQESYSYEEVRYIAMTALTWASLQIEHQIGESHIDDIPNLVAVCEYETIEEAIKETQQSFEDDIYGLVDFIQDWLY